MIEKEYKTIKEQIEILKDRKLIISDKKEEESLKTYLLEYGYERVITGSNSLFKTSNENKDDYDENSRADHLMMAFDIDRNISIEIFKFLSKSGEIKINTIIANTIAGILSEKQLQENGLIFGINDEDYQIIFPNYQKNKNKNILNLKEWIAGESIQNSLYDLEAKEAKEDFEETKIKNQEKVKKNIEENIKNIKDNKNFFANSNDDKSILYLPIWKIANTWTLNSAINIFRCMDKEKQKEIIGNACPKFVEQKISPKEFVDILFWIKNFRNMLAHNYSIYKMNYVLNEKKYKSNFFIEKLKKAKIVPNNIDSNNEVKTGIITFVKLLEVFLNIEGNKIQKAIEEIIEEKFDKKNKDKKHDKGQLEKVKGKIKDIIYEQVYFSK